MNTIMDWYRGWQLSQDLLDVQGCDEINKILP